MLSESSTHPKEETITSLQQQFNQLNQQMTQLKQKLEATQQAEQRSRKASELYRQMLDAVPTMVVCEEGSRFVYGNKAFRDHYGMSQEQLQGMIDASITTSNNTYPVASKAAYPYNTETPLSAFEESFSRGDWVQWFSTVESPVLDAEGYVTNRIKVSSDITRQRQAEAQLEDMKFALDQSSIVAITDRQGVITYVNDKFCEISKYSKEELIGQTHRLINSAHHSKAFFQQMWTTISRGNVWKGEIKNRAKDGSDYWVDTTIVPFLDHNGKPYQYIAIRSEITTRKQMEEELRELNEQLENRIEKRTAELVKTNQELANTLQELQHTQTQLIQSEKMSSLGQLVAGVAHEINNPVNFIYGNLTHANEYTQDLLQLLKLYQQHHPNSHPEVQAEADAIDMDFLVEDLPKILASMKVGADRIQKIVASLRNFSRMDEAEMKEVNIHEGIDSTLMILHHRIKVKSDRPGIEIIKDYGNLPLVNCYAGQLNQVFMNVLSNAIDALEEQVELKHLVSDSEDFATKSDPGKGLSFAKPTPSSSPTIKICTRWIIPDAVEISIADNGAGIPEAIQRRLFDPFFTTKPVGKGTGMGLSISYQIVTERHHGSLQCFSMLGQGTEFVITIPVQSTASSDIPLPITRSGAAIH